MMSVKASMPFIQRSHQLGESYTSGSSPAFQTEIVSLTVEDTRGHESSLRFEETGIEVLKFKTSLTRDDFNDKDKVEQQYCSELAAAILERLGADSIQVFDAQVRPRTTPRNTSDLSRCEDGTRVSLYLQSARPICNQLCAHTLIPHTMRRLSRFPFFTLMLNSC